MLYPRIVFLPLLLLSLVATACGSLLPTTEPPAAFTSPLVKPVELPTTLLEERWILVSLIVGEIPVDIEVLNPSHLYVGESEEYPNAYNLGFQFRCGEDHFRNIGASLIFLRGDNVLYTSRITEDNSCGLALDKAISLFLQFARVTARYSLEGDAFLWHGVDEKTGLDFTIRWERE